MPPHVDAALGELNRYLRDEIPRLMAQPPEILMQHVGTWSVEQSHAQARPVGELLLHALQKVNAPAELGLLPSASARSGADGGGGVSDWFSVLSS